LTFKEMLAGKKVVLFDGGMGTELAGRGCDMSGASNLTSPEAVLEIHREYSRAGADVLITNTFTMNRINIQARGLDIDVRKVNSAGVKLAKEAAGKEKLVFGDIGPSGQLLEPYGSYTEEQIYENYLEQAAILAEEGADGLIIETFTDLREAVCALKAGMDKTGLPVILSLAFTSTDKGGRTVMGSTVAGAAEAAEEFGASAVGANCGDLDPAEMSVIAEMISDITDLPVMVQPNAGKPKLVSGETRFDMRPEEYAEGVKKSITGGASIVAAAVGPPPPILKLCPKN